MKITQIVASIYQEVCSQQESVKRSSESPEQFEFEPEAQLLFRVTETIRGVLDQIQAIYQGNKKPIMEAYNDDVDDTLVEGGLLAMVGTMSTVWPNVKAIQKTVGDLLAKK